LLYLFACLLNIPETSYKVIANKEKKEKTKAHTNERQEKAVCIIQMKTVMVVVVTAAVVFLLVLVNTNQSFENSRCLSQLGSTTVDTGTESQLPVVNV
jgi:predicted transcriptional regulator